MLHAKFQNHRPSGSGKEILKVFTIYSHGDHLGHVTLTIYINFLTKSNALTTEPKSRLHDAVCQRLYLYDTLYRIAVLFIEATHHRSRMNEWCDGT